MGKQQGECKKKKRSPHKGSHYLNFVYPRNMLRRVQRLYARILRFEKKLDKETKLEKAREWARRCASAHGPITEGATARWLRGEKPFSS